MVEKEREMTFADSIKIGERTKESLFGLLF